MEEIPEFRDEVLRSQAKMNEALARELERKPSEWMRPFQVGKTVQLAAMVPQVISQQKASTVAVIQQRAKLSQAAPSCWREI